MKSDDVLSKNKLIKRNLIRNENSRIESDHKTVQSKNDYKFNNISKNRNEKFK